MSQRTSWYSQAVADIDSGVTPDPQAGDDYSKNDDRRYRVDDLLADAANLISSWTGEGAEPADPHSRHLPAIDIDVPARLVESSTPGHHHLFFDVECSWEDYLAMLTAMVKCGLVEEGYVNASAARGQTFLRKRPTKPQGGLPWMSASGSSGTPTEPCRKGRFERVKCWLRQLPTARSTMSP